MADLKINDYTAATAIENTTSFITQTVSGTTQRVPFSVMKDNIVSEFINQGTVLYENASGSTTGVTVMIATGHLYAIDINTNCYQTAKQGRQRVFFVYTGEDNGELAVNIWSKDNGSLFTNTTLSIHSYSVGISITERLTIFKIIDMGVA